LRKPTIPDPSDAVTFMVVPGRTGQIRRMSVPGRWIRGAIGAAVGASLLFIAGAADYVRMRVRTAELDSLREETSEQRDQLQAYAQRMEKLAEGLARVGEFDRKLRVIANLEPGSDSPLAGIGGIEEDDITGGAGLTRARRHDRMLRSLDRLDEATAQEEASLQALIRHLEGQSARLAATPSIAPTKGWITSKFGYRTSPFTGHREFHHGLDVAGRMHTPILASGEGRVRLAGAHGGLGNVVVVEHGYGIETLYGHLAETLVKTGDRVKRGDRVGLMGSTGRSTGPHLHYQVNVNGVAVNPSNYILD
jgi:murein DD-endopeptidase MepM/ murein hydrolase activator NlpD